MKVILITDTKEVWIYANRPYKSDAPGSEREWIQQLGLDIPQGQENLLDVPIMLTNREKLEADVVDVLIYSDGGIILDVKGRIWGFRVLTPIFIPQLIKEVSSGALFDIPIIRISKRLVQYVIINDLE